MGTEKKNNIAITIVTDIMPMLLTAIMIPPLLVKWVKNFWKIVVKHYYLEKCKIKIRAKKAISNH
jgi:hypothetical protein